MYTEIKSVEKVKKRGGREREKEIRREQVFGLE